jgi:transcriptional regulator with XRE-family HTH domain
MVLFRRLLGDVLRRHRQRQGRTLRDVAASARISLGYLSEIERGRKEASSELLGSLCEALDVSLADVLREVSHDIGVLERGSLAPAGFGQSRQVGSTQLPMRPVAAMPVASTPGVPARVAPARVAPSRVKVPSAASSSAVVAATRMPVVAA